MVWSGSGLFDYAVAWNIFLKQPSILGEMTMLEIQIPGLASYQFEHLVSDVNGTIAKDGLLLDGVADLFAKLSSRLKIHLITADTHGLQEAIDAKLGLQAIRIPNQNQALAKLNYIETLGSGKVVAIGNGANDADMLKCAGLGIAVIGPEGAAVQALLSAGVVVRDIREALELLTCSKRLIATLRR
jgi:P-type E1-E2 ATPase